MDQTSNRSSCDFLRFVIVTNHEHWMNACAIRAICFLEENGTQADLLFDGNDYRDIVPSPEAINLGTPCNVLCRTEGHWDEPGRFEAKQDTP
jgi:hypothetical protein